MQVRGMKLCKISTIISRVRIAQYQVSLQAKCTSPALVKGLLWCKLNLLVMKAICIETVKLLNIKVSVEIIYVCQKNITITRNNVGQ